MTSSKLVKATLCGVIPLALFAGALGKRPPAPVEGTSIFFSCDIQGRLLPWACEEGRLGGVARMATVYRQWAAKRPGHIIVDVGNATIGGRKDADIINRFAFDALEKLGCAVVNCGDNEVAMPVEQLIALARDRSFRVVSANVVRADTGKAVLPAYHIVACGGRRIAFIGLVRDNIAPKRLGKGLRLLDPSNALEASLAAVEGKTDLIVVLAYLTPERMYALARKYPKVDIILGGRAEATSAPDELAGRTVLAYLGDNGCTVGRLDAEFPQGRAPKVTGRVALLSDKVADAAGLAPLVQRFKAALGDAELPGSGWDIKMPATSSYVGSDVCRLCHVKEYHRWVATDHAGAYATLLQKREHKNHRCLACHTTGFRMPGGYDPGAAKAQTPLKGVGCECCHGGARRHLGAALKHRKDPGAVKKPFHLRTRPALLNCRRCHSAVRPCLAPGAPDPFNFAKYLNRVRHHKRPAAEGEF